MFGIKPQRSQWLLALLLGAAAGAACGGDLAGSNFQQDQTKWVAATLARLSPEEKAGQMIVVRTFGDSLHSDTVEFRNFQRMVTGWKVGGFLLGNRLDGTAVQPAGAANTAAFLNQMQSLADVPLWVAADLERGAGMRLAEANRFPSPMALASAGDPTSAFETARATGEEARAIGVHWILAPVADVNSNPRNPIINVRSFRGAARDCVELRQPVRLGRARSRRPGHRQTFPGPRQHGTRFAPQSPYGRFRLERPGAGKSASLSSRY